MIIQNPKKCWSHFLISICLVLNHMIQLEGQSIHGSATSKFKFYIKHEAYSGRVNRNINEIAWKGERICKQLILWTTENSAKDLGYEITSLTGKYDTIRSDQLNLRFIRYVRADRISRPCSEYPVRDPLDFDELGDVLSDIPVSTLLPDDPLKLWLTINIPPEVDTGIYSGSVNIRTGNKTALFFPVQVRVMDWKIPERKDWTFHLDLWQYPTRVIECYNEVHPDNKLSYWSAEHFSLLKPMYSILADKGQKAITAHIKEGALGCPPMISWIKKQDGSWDYDYRIFDQYVDSMIKWGIDGQINCQSPIGWNADDIPYWDEALARAAILNAPVGSQEFKTRWDDFLTHFARHLRARGWFEKAVLFMDEIPESQMISVIEIIKKNDPGWKIGVAGFHPLPTGFVTNVYDLSLMYNVPGVDRKDDRISSFYFSCNPPYPNNFIVSDAEASGNVFAGWYARSRNMNGFLRWAYDNWVENDPAEMRTGAHTSGDFCFIYRSSNEEDMKFWSGIRLEMIREGIQDFEKIHILEERLQNPDNAGHQGMMKALQDKIREFSIGMTEPQNITPLVESAQELIIRIIGTY